MSATFQIQVVDQHFERSLLITGEMREVLVNDFSSMWSSPVLSEI